MSKVKTYVELRRNRGEQPKPEIRIELDEEEAEDEEADGDGDNEDEDGQVESSGIVEEYRAVNPFGDDARGRGIPGPVPRGIPGPVPASTGTGIDPYHPSIPPNGFQAPHNPLALQHYHHQNSHAPLHSHQQEHHHHPHHPQKKYDFYSNIIPLLLLICGIVLLISLCFISPIISGLE
jgi:hypothetical protein